MGSLDNVIFMEGAWNLLSEMRDIASLLGGTSPPYYEIDYSATSFTIYDIIKQILNVAGFGLFALGGEDDSIIDTLQPDFVVNAAASFEDAATDIYRLLNMTKTFCRNEEPDTNAANSGSSEVTADNPSGFTSPSARTGFFAETRYWVFYSDGTDVVYKTSTDGSSWSSPTTIGTGSGATSFRLWYDRANNKIHYVRRLSSTGSEPVYWREGTPNSDGTITWTAAEQTVFTDSTTGTDRGLGICVDTDGYVFISYIKFSEDKPYCAKNANNDGIWSQDNEELLQNTVDDKWYIQPIPLPNGKVCVMYTAGALPDNIDNIQAKTWSGSAWGSEETATSGTIGAMGTAVVVDDDLYLTYLDDGDDIMVVKRDSDGSWGTPVEIEASVDAASYPQLSVDVAGSMMYLVYGGDGSSKQLWYYKWVNGVWDSSATVLHNPGGPDVRGDFVRTFYHLEGNDINVIWLEEEAGPVFDLKFYYETTIYGNMSSFRVLYPGGYSSYDYTYLSDKPSASDHQFREFDWRDQPRIPNTVKVICNRETDGSWIAANIIVGKYEYNTSDNNEYPEIVEYYVAATLTSQGDANNRATAIATRRHMEQELGRVLVPHNCGQELYDWIKIRDKRGTGSYTDYPPSRWGNLAIVGALTHIYDPANGIYNLEITINGIESAPPTGEVFRKTVTEIEEEIIETVDYLGLSVKNIEDIWAKDKADREREAEEQLYFPTNVPLTQYGQERLQRQMSELVQEYGMEGLKERFLKASEEFRKTDRWKELEERRRQGDTFRGLE